MGRPDVTKMEGASHCDFRYSYERPDD